ncbi:hypothetical protein R4036_004587 [Salmonella enterica]|nr:hypothetical protein [Salmonella enterica]
MKPNINKLMEKHQHENMTPKHFKFGEKIKDHLEGFLDGLESNIENRYTRVIRELQLDKKHSESVKENIKNKAELDFLAEMELFTLFKMAVSDASQQMKQIKEIHLQNVYH